MEKTIKIEKLVFGGDGMGRLDGKVVFVEGALPGEVVTAEITSEKKKFSKAKLIDVKEVSPSRVEPPCPYYAECGGCQYQHIEYEDELKWKEAQVRETLTRALGLDEKLINSIAASPNEYRYRNSVTLHKAAESDRLGFVGRDNKSLVCVDDCLLADERLKIVFNEEHSLEKDETRRTFSLAEDGMIVTSEEPVAYRVKIGDESFWASSAGFFQNNLSVTELVAKKAAEIVGESKPALFIDLYSGVGVFSVLAAKNVTDISCFEDNETSVDCAKRNFMDREMNLVEIIPGRAEKTFPKFVKAELGGQKAFLFLDPPRRGLAPALNDLLAGTKSFTDILYLSCDVSILARDLKQILARDVYEVKGVWPFDMFPRTKHVEVLTWLKTKV